MLNEMSVPEFNIQAEFHLWNGYPADSILSLPENLLIQQVDG